MLIYLFVFNLVCYLLVSVGITNHQSMMILFKKLEIKLKLKRLIFNQNDIDMAEEHILITFVIFLFGVISLYINMMLRDLLQLLSLLA